MNWMQTLEFTRGPLFQVALLVFVAGMLYRLFRVVFLGWQKDKVPAVGSKFGGTVKSFLKGKIVTPFESVLFFIDKQPEANWEHAASLFCIQPDTKEIKQFPVRIPPRDQPSGSFR